MASVTVRSGASAETPTAAAAVPAAPLGPDSFRDSRGRIFTVRTLSILEQMRLLRRLGGENGPYYSFCLRLSRVATIDGDPVRIPETDLQFEALAQRLGDAGVIALTMFLTGGDEDEDEPADPAAAKAAAEAQDATERQTVKN